MEKTTVGEKERKRESRLGSILRGAMERRRDKTEESVYDIAAFLLALLFSRCHIIFGAHPLGLAFIAVLPSRVWIATLGAVLGSLTLGKSGVIYAMISVIVVFLRVIVSGTERAPKKEGGRLVTAFGEGLLLRMSSAVIGGFIAGVYEILLSGFSPASMLFGLSMILLPPLTVFALSGLFEGGISPILLLSTDERALSLKGKGEREKYDLVFFQASVLVLLFLTSLSLKEYTLIGISPSYIFSAVVTLAVAKRFGALRAVAVGFASALGLSSSLAVSFALLGLGAGILFKVGTVYAVIGGGAALCMWASYSGGLTGLLGVLPEYAMAALISMPLLKRLSLEKSEEESVDTVRLSQDMVGTVALSYKSKYRGALDALSVSFHSLSGVVREYTDRLFTPTRTEVRELILECVREYMGERTGYEEKYDIPEQKLEEMTNILYKNGRITPDVFVGIEQLEAVADSLCETVNRAIAILNERAYAGRRGDGYAEYFDLTSRIVSEARMIDEREKSVNEEMSARLSELPERVGLSSFTVKAFGQRRLHIVLAAEDESGKKITSPELLSDIERVAGPVTSPEFFRKGKMALLECEGDKRFALYSAVSRAAADGETVSGDTAGVMESDEGRFLAFISDGVGTGEVAREASGFVADFITGLPDFATVTHTALKLLNHIIRRGGEEHAATVDLFSFDMLTGEGEFVKCGAAASYIKRGSSIFRIRSRTSPLGVVRTVEAEKIRADVNSGDYIIMLSDGITALGDDAPWLLELLAKEPPSTVKEYADRILSEAKRNIGLRDDMTVLVTKITPRRGYFDQNENKKDKEIKE